mmetsp:Transcript_131514/g.420831  ORF Transcript_131514/g.420831 Transcript_131514/m.420831 type:complete len:169 (+) Transcript_131514:563-1069(+)
MEVLAYSDDAREKTRTFNNPDGKRFVTCFHDSMQSTAVVIFILTSDPDGWVEKAGKVLPQNMLHGPGKIAITNYKPKPLVALQPAGMDKGVALRQLCDELGIALDETIAFGDGINDVEFLEAAGCGIAPSNAVDEAKRAADVVLQLSNGEDAVAKALLELHGAGHFAS